MLGFLNTTHNGTAQPPRRKRDIAVPILVSTLIWLSLPFRGTAEGNFVAKYVECTVIVDDPEQAVFRMARYAGEKGGYMLSYEAGKLVLKIPISTSSIMAYLRKQGKIRKHRIKMEDIKQRYDEIAHEISAKENHIRRLRALYRTSDYKETLDLEKEITGTISALEVLKSERHNMDVQRRYVEVVIRLRTAGERESCYGEGCGRAVAPWIEDLNIEDFLSGF